MNESWFANAGMKLFAVESGEGVPIMLLHGGLSTHAGCRIFAAPLAARFRLVTPDLRGSGRSHFGGDLTWDLLADDIAALARQLGIARAVIGGVSFGAGCAVRVALRHPELVAALVILTPAFGGADVGLAPAQQAAMDAMNAAGSRAVAEGIRVLHPLFESLPEPVRARARVMVEAYDPASVAASTRFMASGAQPFGSAAELATIAAPTLLVPGTDPEHPAEIADLYRRHLRRCTVYAGTAPEYAAAIATFIDQENPC